MSAPPPLPPSAGTPPPRPALPPFDAHIRPEAWVTAGVPSVGGRLRERPDDFLVEEIPSYEPSGHGEHIYMLVEKRNLSTLHMVRILADHFGVRREAVGVAGLKDKAAVTRQLVSVHVPGRKPDDFPAVKHDALTIHWTDLHTNKLRRGHLKGNRFIIRIRGVDPSKAVHAHRALATLERVGVPNRAGMQRFGFIENNHLVGRALLLGDDAGVLSELLGPSEKFPAAQPEARSLFAAGRHEEALRAFHGTFHTERRVLAALARGCQPRRAVEAIERLQRSFYVTAFQSAVFNAVLDQRLADGTFATILEGDLAFKHDTGAVFDADAAVVDDPLTRDRVASLRISPSGPMWGDDMTRAGGRVGQLESAALAATGVPESAFADFAKRWRDPAPGQRRPLRVPLTYPDVEGGVDEHGTYIKCRFELPRGAFATVVMQEIMKSETVAAGDDEESEA